MSIAARLGRAVIVAFALVAVSAQAVLGWGVVWAIDHHQWLSDRSIALQFEADAELLDYVDQAAMSPEGEVYFFASQPQVVPALEFDRYCSRDEPGIGVLGCYRLGERRIYLYDVTDPRLGDMEPVIAAHEMLHAVWDRFDAGTQADIAVLLEEGFATLPSDHPLRERIESYEAFDPNSRIPELYALLGTEARILPTELEEHYRVYFSDRTRVVELAEQVHSIFDSFDQELQTLVSDLEARADVIDERKAQYELESEILGADIAVYNDRVSRYNDGEDVDGAEDFPEERNSLIERQARLRVEQNEIQALIDQYNALLDELNVLNQELRELNRGINITLEEQDELDDTDTVDQQS